jgi:hypothetical protein
MKIIGVSIKYLGNSLRPSFHGSGQFMKEKYCAPGKYTQPPKFVICHAGPSWSASEFPPESWGFHTTSA